jgi:hypothetical protein
LVGTILEKMIFNRMMTAIFEHRKQALDRAFAAEIEQSRMTRTS